MKKMKQVIDNMEPRSRAELATCQLRNGRPASLNKRLNNLFNDLTVRHCQSLPAIPHRLARV
jgi:hypothetical protein